MAPLHITVEDIDPITLGEKLNKDCKNRCIGDHELINEDRVTIDYVYH